MNTAFKLRYFPEIRPGELFLSIVARYADHLRLWQRNQVQEQLFGKGNIAVGIEMPRGFEILVNRLPWNCEISVDELINKHTLLPLYKSFMSDASHKMAVQMMRGFATKDVMAVIAAT